MSQTEVIVKKSSNFDLCLHNKWRPALGWAYVSVVVFDFILAPIMWSILQASNGGDLSVAWSPLTLEANGLFIVSMSAIVGVNSYGRTKEKVEGKIREVFLGKEPAPNEET